MPLIFRLVGSNKQIVSNFEGLINLSQIQNEFKKIGVSEADIDKIKFITDRSVVTDTDKTFVIKNDVDYVMFIFADMSFRPAMISLFDTYGIEQKPENHMVEDKTIMQPLQVKPEPSVPKMTEETIVEANKTAEKILGDKDLMTLFDIYMRRPELFSTFAKYTQHGTIVEDSINTKVISDLSPEELEHYRVLAEQITLPISDEIKINALLKYKGHIKLALRSIISSVAVGLP
jgi:hypothetical protein